MLVPGTLFNPSGVQSNHGFCSVGNYGEIGLAVFVFEVSPEPCLFVLHSLIFTKAGPMAFASTIVSRRA